MFEKPYSEAAERNSNAILEVLRHEFYDCREVLEIGSGTGQHAVRIAAEMKHLLWQTSDRDENHDGIRAWIAEAALPNVRNPLSLDVISAELAGEEWDAIFSCNTAHIMSYPAVVRMFRLATKSLRPGGVFALYGPFRIAGKFNTRSNAEFDASLRYRDPAMGIRDLDDLDKLAEELDLTRRSLYAVPANNMVAVWKKTANELR